MDETRLPPSEPENESAPPSEAKLKRPEPTTASVAAVLAADYVHPARRRRVALPVVLFLLTCLSTFLVGAAGWRPDLLVMRTARAVDVLGLAWAQGHGLGALGAVYRSLQLDVLRGLVFMAAAMGILLTHEMGHFLATLKYKIPASLPFFLPVPIIPFGTLGAVIAMQNSRADRRQLFDLGIAGPLAGLVVALPVLILGIRHLDAGVVPGSEPTLSNPLLICWMIEALRPDVVSPESLSLGRFNPLLMAGWLGILVTGLNMVPLSQLDGGHVAYGLLGRRAHTLARLLVVAAIITILVFEAYIWVPMFALVVLLGIHHPPTADDFVPLGWPRRILGYASLVLPVLCFPPMT